MRWIYHLRVIGPLADPYSADSLSSEGFIHCSYQPAVLESARLYFPADARLEALQIDPRALEVEVADTPRGPMPHVRQAIPGASIVRRWSLEEFSGAPDEMD
jgi:uncharacterized protein (DUF952 family)